MKKFITSCCILLVCCFGTTAFAQDTSYTQSNFHKSRAKAAAASSYNVAIYSIAIWGIAIIVGIGVLCSIVHTDAVNSDVT